MDVNAMVTVVLHVDVDVREAGGDEGSVGVGG
jgi:hypothetical protein